MTRTTNLSARSVQPTPVPPAAGERPPRPRLILSAGVAVLLTASLGAPSAADATIAPGKGLAKLKLGATRADARALLGKPINVQRYKGGSSEFFEKRGGGTGYWITLDTKGRMKGIDVRDPKEKTAEGVGPGSSMAQLKKAYRGQLACQDVDFLPKLKVCRLNGTIPTDFLLDRKKIARVQIGDIGEFRYSED